MEQPAKRHLVAVPEDCDFAQASCLANNVEKNIDGLSRDADQPTTCPVEKCQLVAYGEEDFQSSLTGTTHRTYTTIGKCLILTEASEISDHA